ncbi:hypothetical protein Pmani_037853 [Petrolisthes manimaculis]|uniref:Uncharacterized protein n=1 Tax=Petrolisthes manimaculis TaxID=1843537 RepID=A0AAE1NHC3_9EUCA|nr:hypothetical protein Pmani_037853 [Petrolisthes manimaculis]
MSSESQRSYSKNSISTHTGIDRTRHDAKPLNIATCRYLELTFISTFGKTSRRPNREMLVLAAAPYAECSKYQSKGIPESGRLPSLLPESCPVSCGSVPR